MPVISAMSGAWYGSAGVSAKTLFWPAPPHPVAAAPSPIKTTKRIPRVVIE
jgi:hypothetical protein